MSNSLHNKLKTRIILALIILGLLCTSLFFLTACGDSTTKKDPSYSYTDTDDGLISNPSFSYGTADIELKNFPQTSPTGWSRSKDSTGSSSSAKSGVIDLSDDGWKELLKNLCNDTYFFKYLYKEFKKENINIDKAEIKKLIALEKEDADYSPTSDEVNTYIVEKYLIDNDKIFLKPTVRTGATDNKVYMLNNYTSDLGAGASQKITANKSVTINKGEYVKFTVYVLTQNGMSGINGDDFGASIRLTNTFNGTSQAEYAVTNIKTDGEWKSYTLYAKGDSDYACTVTLALGLGYNARYQTQGTVYFDDITVEHLTEDEYLNETAVDQTSTFVYDSDDKIIVEAENKTSFLYDMTLADVSGYNTSITPTISGELTKSNNNDITSADKGWNSNGSFDANTNTITVTDASYSVTISDASFNVTRESYAYVSFKILNNLSKLGSTTITVDLYEKHALGDVKKSALTTVTEVDETTNVGLMVKNNFDEKDTKFDLYDQRSFYIVVVVGPTNVSTADNKSDYATGTVVISDFEIAKGKTYQYDDSDNETDNYKYYKLYSGVANGTASLFAGYDSDFTAATDTNNTSSGFAVSEADASYINTRTVAPSEYDGIVSNHIYITDDANASNEKNERAKGVNGSYAGVVDTKYTYTNFSLDTIKDIKGDDDIRPLMIYNATEDSYGFVANTDAKVISANSYAKVSVTLKVSDDATAYIYLVETSSKEVMKFATFTPKYNGLDAIDSDKQQEVSGDEFKFEVTKDTPTTDDGWVTVEFYVATGNAEKSFRVELWNGSRDGEDKSQGYVFIKSVNVSLSGGFTAPENFNESFTDENSPLWGKGNAFNICLGYSRPLTEREKEFNIDYPDDAISYSPQIVWAQNDNMIYAIFNNIEYEITDPYDSIVEEETDDDSGCAATTDPATFWLSFSSILLAVVLILAIVMLTIKTFRRRRKAYANDAKSHYTVKSRVRKAPNKASTKKQDEIVDTEDIVEETAEVEEEQSPAEETEEIEEVTEENTEPTLDDYVYGEVQDFGEDTDKN